MTVMLISKMTSSNPHNHILKNVCFYLNIFGISFMAFGLIEGTIVTNSPGSSLGLVRVAKVEVRFINGVTRPL